MSKLSNQTARDLLVEEYIKRCQRIIKANPNEDLLESFYKKNIKDIQEHKSFSGAILFITDDGDFNEDPDAVIDLLQVALIEG